MRCVNCGNDCSPQVKVCPKCGKKVHWRIEKSGASKTAIICISFIIILGALVSGIFLAPVPLKYAFIIFFLLFLFIGGIIVFAYLESKLKS